MTISNAAGYRTVTVKLWRGNDATNPLDSISSPLAMVTLPVTGGSFTVAAPGSLLKYDTGAVSDPAFVDLGHLGGISCGVTSVRGAGS
jgi:hypothetical protein